MQSLKTTLLTCKTTFGPLQENVVFALFYVALLGKNMGQGAHLLCSRCGTSVIHAPKPPQVGLQFRADVVTLRELEREKKGSVFGRDREIERERVKDKRREIKR